jgi:hypothetical protein
MVFFPLQKVVNWVLQQKINKFLLEGYMSPRDTVLPHVCIFVFIVIVIAIVIAIVITTETQDWRAAVPSNFPFSKHGIDDNKGNGKSMLKLVTTLNN